MRKKIAEFSMILEILRLSNTPVNILSKRPSFRLKSMVYMTVRGCCVVLTKTKTLEENRQTFLR